MLTLFHSNRQEVLITQLAELTRHGRPTPLSAETIVTQSPGMARWIAIQLAQRLGVAAHYEFPLPSSFFWNLFTRQFPELGETSGYDKPVLTWRIIKRLPNLLDREAFAPLARYLAEDGSDRRYHQLARRIADVFDQYLIYRPEMILEWDRGEGEGWQPVLWRELVEDTGGRPHRAGLLQGFIDNCRAGRLDASRLPHRLSFFGIPTLPPAYLQLLQCLAEHTEVNLFLLNPSPRYWGEIVDEKLIAHKRRKLVLSGDGEADHLEVENRLLASLGKQGKQFLTALTELQGEEVETFIEGHDDTLLGRLQQDIFELEETRLSEMAADDSLGLHSCHSPLREVEVLHNTLLERFNADPTLQPEDVIVMTPDVETYAPYIEAVFGAAQGNQHIPWSISDRTPHGEHPAVRAFQSLLDVASGRFAINEVLSLLESPNISRRFGLELDDLARLRHWLHDSGVRWGLDERTRDKEAIPHGGHTWSFGLRRLLLGYALPPDATLYKGIAPYPDIEGQAALALGRLIRFLELLERLQQRLKGSYPAGEWMEIINDSLKTFFHADDDTDTALQWVREAMAELARHQHEAGYDRPIDLQVVRDVLNAALDNAQSDTRFLNGRLTFCTLLPMRSLPFRVVAMIGMNDGAFPRPQHPMGFDLIALHPRAGDRSRRDDERYLFLEALISARDALYISYVGRDIRDNTERNPSVLVAELLDTLEYCYGKPLREQVLTEHPMQPFSPRNYADLPGLYSYDADWLRGLTSPHQGVPVFNDTPLATEHDLDEIDLEQLIAFFDNPSRAFLQQRLQIGFPREEEALQDDEPFAMNALERYFLQEELLDHALAGEDDIYELLEARGELPAAPFDRLSYEAMRDNVASLITHLAGAVSDSPTKREIELSLEATTLRGVLRPLHHGELVRARPAELKAKDRLRNWIYHLAHCAASDTPVKSHYYGKDRKLEYQYVADAAKQLSELVSLYREGLTRPLPFFPETSWHSAHDKPGEASKAWQKDDYNSRKSESEDDYIALAMRGRDPLDEEHQQLAKRIYAPLMAALEESKYA
jgi:exodeoxyribonuclease V gamma subunit